MIVERTQMVSPAFDASGPFSGLASGHDVRALVVVAHPDDETIAVGGQLRSWPSTHLVHLTQGAPADTGFAQTAGFGSQTEYATARAAELDRALQLVGFDRKRHDTLGYVDQQACYALFEITWTLVEIIQRHQPELVITHAYEGGHPDHDAAAFAVRAACTLHQRHSGVSLPLLEAPFYHRSPGGLAFGRFLPPPVAVPELELKLSEPQSRRKAQMLACFASQESILAPFPRDCERFRTAPSYDFCARPHAYPLHYDTLGWKVTSADWLECAYGALEALKLPAARGRKAHPRTGAL